MNVNLYDRSEAHGEALLFFSFSEKFLREERRDVQHQFMLDLHVAAAVEARPEQVAEAGLGNDVSDLPCQRRSVNLFWSIDVRVQNGNRDTDTVIPPTGPEYEAE